MSFIHPRELVSFIRPRELERFNPRHVTRYRHPSQNLECFHQAMKSKLEILNNESCEVYITGDINIDFFPIQH